ncbi:glycosyltransferase family 2 protein [Aeromicrobium chenweiae]|uniref:Glycosyltransferase family 2 protein n=1 Tax=Aeromicrobium chenweiae TaxID=2079793 RepID=A0A2S0WM48_9ACTN|nr:glycosyltransferase family 2 protein [Aeromicrobium chenweiae]
MPQAVRNHYRSVDSAPVEFSLDRPASVVNGFFVSFVALGLLVLLAVTLLAREGPLGDHRDVVVFGASGDETLIPVRLFLVVFFVVFSLHLGTNAWRRALVLAELCAGLIVISLAVDTVALLIRRLWSVDVPTVDQQAVSAVLALALFPVVILRNAQLPDPVTTPATGVTSVSAWLRFLAPMVAAIVLARVIATQAEPVVTWLRDVALLGGVGPGVFLVQQLFVLLAGAIGVVRIGMSRRSVFAPPVAVIVPAHNEAHGIARTIAALDRAAGAYRGSVRLYVVENVSSDDTAAVAQNAIDASGNLGGTLLSCRTPGKAPALNYGLGHVEEPFVVRIDADAVIGENCLRDTMRHFADDRVGAVGGMPLPAHTGTFIDRVRYVEVLVRHGFHQVSRTGYDGIVGVPGMFTAIRRSALVQAGPIAQGINGEDTDICMRLSSLGYRCLVDPAAQYRTETPDSWAQLREQRLRWFRSTYHVAARQRHVLLHGVSMASAVVLPLGLVNSARRAMLAPVLVFALLVLGVFSPTFHGLHWQPVLAVVIGLPALVAIVVSFLLRRPRAVLYVPEYLAFRLVRSYFTLEALLSLRFLPLDPPWRSRPAERAADR